MYKDFRAEEDRIRDELEVLLSVRDVRRILAVSVGEVLRLVRTGKLDGICLDGPVKRGNVDTNTYGVRITPSSLQRYQDEIRIC